MKLKITAKKVKNQLKEWIQLISEEHIAAFAAQSAFFFVLSFIPFLMVFVSLIKYTSITENMLVAIVKDFSPTYIEGFLTGLVSEVYSNSMRFLSITIILAIWSSAKGAQNLLNSLNAVYQVKETRNWLAKRFWAVVYTLLFMLTMIISLLLVAFGRHIQKLLHTQSNLLQRVTNVVINGRFFFLLLLLITFFIVMMKILPNRKATMRSQIPGAIFSAVGWYFCSFIISIYVNDFNGFSMYGSLTTGVLVMIWLYFCMYILLIGGKINVAYGEKFEKLIKKKDKKIVDRS